MSPQSAFPLRSKHEQGPLLNRWLENSPSITSHDLYEQFVINGECYNSFSGRNHINVAEIVVPIGLIMSKILLASSRGILEFMSTVRMSEVAK